MGMVFENQQLRTLTGERESKHFEALRAIFYSLEGLNRNNSNFGVVFQAFGSSTTGEADVRSDLDGIVFFARIKDGEYVRSRSEEEVVAQELFRRSLIMEVENIAQRFGVRAEFHYFSLIDALEADVVSTIRGSLETNRSELEKSGSFGDDPMFVDHIRASPETWRINGPIMLHGEDNATYWPLEKILSRGIDIHGELGPREVSIISFTVYRYMTNRTNTFARGIQECRAELPLDRQRFQRALEFAKASARKLMAFVAAVEPTFTWHEEADVTSKKDMYHQFRHIAAQIDPEGERGIWQYCSYIIEMNQEYSDIVTGVQHGGSVDLHEKWLIENAGAIYEAAYFLASACWRYIDDALWNRPEIEIANFFEDYDELYRLTSPDDHTILV